MGAGNTPIYLVNVQADPVLVRVRGRASFMNSQLIRDFFQQSIRAGTRRFAVDFAECTGMDSTFLGVLAGTAIELRNSTPRGVLIFCRLGPRNLELVRNLGLHRLATIDCGPGTPAGAEAAGRALEGPRLGEKENAELCLRAHESLVEADANNLAKFQDVIGLLKDTLGKG
jgi:anti-sigma B factor antagonist